MTIPLTDEERDALHRLAAEADLSMVQLVRRWIRDASAKKGV